MVHGIAGQSSAQDDDSPSLEFPFSIMRLSFRFWDSPASTEEEH
jgi:hypothetical protein